MPRARTQIVVVLGLLAALAGCQKCVTVVHRVQSQRELNTILVHFDRAGIGPVEVVAHESRREKSWEIRVPQPQVELARQLLVALDLPRKAEPADAASSSLIPSPEELAQQARLRLQRRLEAALEMYDGVVRARVLIAPERRDELTQKLTQAPSASVVVRYVVQDGDGDPAPSVAERQVQQIVAGAVPALAPEQVQVSYARITLPKRTMPRVATRTDPPVPPTGNDRWREALPRYLLPIAGGLTGLAGGCAAIALLRRRPRTAVVAEG